MIRKTSLVISATLAAAAITLPQTAGGEAGPEAAESADGPKYVFLLTIDGARPDDAFGIQARNTPNLDGLARRGVYSWNAITVHPSRTLDAVPSLLTGAYPNTHDYSNGAGTDAESLFEVFSKAGHETLAIDGKNGERLDGFKQHITYYVADDYEYEEMRLEGDNQLMSDFLDLWDDHKTAFAYALLPTVDSVGHALGHESEDYATAIERADEAIGKFVDYLHDEGVHEESLIIVTADHGMTGINHGGTAEGDMKIPLIIAGPGVAPGDLSKISRPERWEGSDGALAYHGEIVDVAPTITKLFGIRAPANAEGEVLPVAARQ